MLRPEVAAPVSLDALAQFVEERRRAADYGDVPTVWRPATRPVARLRLALEFDGLEAALAHGVCRVERVAVMNAMRADLVEEAAADGVDLYLTGQVRAPGRGPAERLGIGVVAIGHRRSELWGLRQLGRELEEAFPGLVARVLGPARGPNGRAGW